MTLHSWLSCAVLALTVFGAAPSAHHPLSRTYRTDERATVDGVIVSIVLRSPHSYLEVRAQDAQKHVRVWSIECGDHRVVRKRLVEGSLRPGDRVIVTGEPSRDDGEFRVRLRRLVRPTDGWEWREADR